MNETPAKLAAALAAAQAELPAVTKNRTADVIGKDGRRLYTYSYADLADVSAAILPILGKHELAFTALPGHQENGKFGLRYYLMHSSGESLDGFWEIGDQGGMQVTGGRITYARRYCLCAVTGVTAEEDVDARGDGQDRKPRQQRPDSNGEQQQTRTMQRRQRTPDPSLAADPPDGAAATAGPAREATLPPLPGEDDVADNSGMTGLIVTHFKRLGVTDRNDRLILTAQLGRLDDIPSSTSKLTRDQQRDVLNKLAKCRDGDALQALLTARQQDEAAEATS